MTLCRASRLPVVRFQTRRWCSRSGCSPQCRCRRIWGTGARSKRPQPPQEEEAWCAFFSTASVWADHVRSSVILPPPQVFSRWRWGVFSALSPEIHHQLLGLVDVEGEVILQTQFSQVTHLLSVGHHCQWSGLSPLWHQQICRWRWSCVWL